MADVPIFIPNFEKLSQNTAFMLLEFSVANFLSFKTKETLSLMASSIREFEETNVILAGRNNLLKGAILYGANSSGKSNFIRAMSTMRRLIVESFEQSSANELDITPFLLNTVTEKAPSHFEVIFLIGETRYRYGFEVDNRIVHAEWLFAADKQTEKPLFVREKDGIEVMDRVFPEGRHLEERTRDNALFLAVVDQFNGKISKEIIRWFKRFFITISGLRHEGYKAITFAMLENKTTQPLLMEFYRDLSLGFQDIATQKTAFDPMQLPKNMPEAIAKQLVTDLEDSFKIDIRTLHTKFDQDDQPAGTVEFDMRSQESSGTNKLFNISGPVFDALIDGGALIIDELDASMHPLLTLAITRLFNSVKFNRNNAQLIFATHDTNILSYGRYRRDQVYFVEKDNCGASKIYSLVEYKEDGKAIRKDRSFEKDYIEGRYGAIPFIGEPSNLIGKWPEK
jgi:AAA15 family ATPase/GTPase